MRRRNRTIEKGFTLVEVMVAMGLLMVGMSTILGLLSFGLALHRSSMEKGRASLAVDAVLRDIRYRSFPPGSDGQPGDPQSLQEIPVPDRPDMSYSARFEENPELPGEYLVKIEIAWKEKGKRRFQKFQTMLLREAPFEERMKKALGRP